MTRRKGSTIELKLREEVAKEEEEEVGGCAACT
jgi:hypothetical protein